MQNMKTIILRLVSRMLLIFDCDKRQTRLIRRRQAIVNYSGDSYTVNKFKLNVLTVSECALQSVPLLPHTVRLCVRPQSGALINANECLPDGHELKELAEVVVLAVLTVFTRRDPGTGNGAVRVASTLAGTSLPLGRQQS